MDATNRKGKGRASKAQGGDADGKKNNNSSSKSNNEARRAVAGVSTLPAARVSKVIKADKDIKKCSKEAIFLASIATEHFIRRFADAGYTRARMDKRKVITYKDISSSCNPDTEFYFLEEVIPKPVDVQSALKTRADRLMKTTPIIDVHSVKAASRSSSMFATQIFPVDSLQPGQGQITGGESANSGGSLAFNGAHPTTTTGAVTEQDHHAEEETHAQLLENTENRRTSLDDTRPAISRAGEQTMEVD